MCYNFIFRAFENVINFELGKKYCNDGDFVFPWYDEESIVTIEGPTSQHSIVQVLVRLLHFFSK